MIRKNIPENVSLVIFRRDNWHCRYCNRPVFFGPTLKLLAEISKNPFYYHPHGKYEAMALAPFYAEVDHIKPVEKGGTNELNNLVTTCVTCNSKNSNKSIGEGKKPPLEIKDSKWDGFSGLYPELIVLMGKKPDDWVKLLQNAYKP
jgi:5-methylcytosine-specific restriction endonuclease McrA